MLLNKRENRPFTLSLPPLLNSMI